MTDHLFVEGDRVRVRPEFDELALLLGIPTRPGTVVTVYPETIVVAEDGVDGTEAAGTSAPYPPHQLEKIG